MSHNLFLSAQIPPAHLGRGQRSCDIAAAAPARLFSLELHKFLSLTRHEAQSGSAIPAWDGRGTGWVKAGMKAGISSVLPKPRKTRSEPAPEVL